MESTPNEVHGQGMQWLTEGKMIEAALGKKQTVRSEPLKSLGNYGMMYD